MGDAPEIKGHSGTVFATRPGSSTSKKKEDGEKTAANPNQAYNPGEKRFFLWGR